VIIVFIYLTRLVRSQLIKSGATQHLEIEFDMFWWQAVVVVVVLEVNQARGLAMVILAPAVAAELAAI
jgi:hypothetical protein